MKIVKDMILTPSVQFSTIVNYKLIEHTLMIMEELINTKQDWCAEDLVSVLAALIDKAEESFLEITQTNIYDEAFDIETEVQKLLESLYPVIYLLQNASFSIQDKASQCIYALLYKFE